MRSTTRNLRKSALCMAMGLCLASLAAPVLAQSVTGAVAGHARPGAQITITNEATGLRRMVTVGADGNYRIGQLPPGNYTVAAGGPPVAVAVSLGGTTTVNLDSSGVAKLGTVQVVGSRIVNRVDVRTTEASTNLRRSELARLPVDQTLASVALLAPGVVATGATFGGLTFGGASVAENVTYINGLDVTDLYRRQGFSTVPYAFFEAFQVKTGGYSAEFGRSTGGVINAVTRSGGNEFHAGAEATIQPAAWASSRKDHFHKDGTIDERDRTSRDENPLYKLNLWASGPIVKDRLFFFAMVEKRNNDSRDVDTTEAWKTKNDNNFWGAKLDWHLNDDHLIEFLAFSDKADSTTDSYDYDWNAKTYSASTGQSTDQSGGDNWSLTYTGNFSDNFVAKLLYGVNKRSSLGGSPWDAGCSIVRLAGSYIAKFPDPGKEGCHPSNDSVSTRYDERDAARIDFEWTLGDHLLRFGADQEIMDSDSTVFYPGDGVSYEAQGATPGSLLANNAVVPAGVQAIIDARRYITGAPIETKAQAFYVEDNWSITTNWLLVIGLRADKFHN